MRMMHRRIAALFLSLLLLSLAACGGDGGTSLLPTSGAQGSTAPGETQNTDVTDAASAQNQTQPGEAAAPGSTTAAQTIDGSTAPSGAGDADGKTSGTAPAQGEIPGTTPGASAQTTAQTTVPTTVPPTTADPGPRVTLIVDCSTAVENGVREQPGYDQILPADGIILRDDSYPLEPGKDSALDLLQRALGEKSIPIKVRGGYISSIGGLKERILPDAYGKKSKGGWIYLVNGSMPGVSSAAYKPQAGDTILFAYTCEEGDIIMKQLD